MRYFNCLWAAFLTPAPSRKDTTLPPLPIEHYGSVYLRPQIYLLLPLEPCSGFHHLEF
uniref:Uncharacterized protein n=1 Tax=Anguilla anguilla TaxID=7936 RepID=A0A0E9X9U8_ANGAN